MNMIMEYSMKRSKLTEIALATALLATAGLASASSYYVVIPVAGKSILLSGINVALNSYSLPSAIVGLPYSGFNFNNVLSVTGDPDFSSTRVSWSLTSGALPPGLALSRDGQLTGTPSASGNSSFVLRAMYKTRTGEQTYQVAVTDLVVGLAATSMPAGVQGAPYSVDLKTQLSVVGDAAYTGAGVSWSVVAGALPAGLSLTADGIITGTPAAENSGAPFTVQAAYKTKAGQQSYQVVVGAIVVRLDSATLPAGKNGVAYSFDFKPYLGVSGDAAYSAAGSAVVWSVVGGVLPSGLSLNPTSGVLSGTPVGSPTGATFTVQAAYSTKTGKTAYSLVVATTPVVLAPTSWGPGGSPQAYYYGDQTVAASCKDYRNGKTGFAAAAATGYYWVNMGAGTERVYCDMTTNGGGWTLVARSAGTIPAFVGCSTDVSVNTPFGWTVARGTPDNTAAPYSMNVFSRSIAFTEVLIGDSSGTSNSWGAYVYRQTLPVNFKTSLSSDDVPLVDGAFAMSSRMGHTTDTTQYFFRDMPDGVRGQMVRFGLHADGWFTCYGDGPNSRPEQGASAFNGGNINYRHGMLMVR